MEDVRLILLSLWAAVDFCLVFAAILGNYKPGHLKGMIEGEVDGIKTTQGVVAGNAIMMAIQSVMVFLSLILPYPIISWVNIILGIFYAGFYLVDLTAYLDKPYYVLLGIFTIVFFALIIWYAWKWPKQEG